MKKKSLLFCFLFSCLFAFSQNTKPIHGKVSYHDAFQKNVDVINFTTKKMVQTDISGEFIIDAKADDVLIFLSDNFADQKYTLTAKDFENSALIIKLLDKPVPLKEVEIRQIKAIKVESTSYNGIKMAQLEKQQSNPVNKDVYVGDVPMGVDFIQIGKMVGKLFKSNKPKPDEKATLSFTDYAKANFDDAFFTKTLQLKPEEKPRFLEFCEKDPEAKTAIASNDELTILQFLLAKKAAFDKLK